MTRKLSEMVREFVQLELRIMDEARQIQYFPKAEREFREVIISKLSARSTNLAKEIDDAVDVKVESKVLELRAK